MKRGLGPRVGRFLVHGGERHHSTPPSFTDAIEALHLEELMCLGGKQLRPGGRHVVFFQYIQSQRLKRQKISPASRRTVVSARASGKLHQDMSSVGISAELWTFSSRRRSGRESRQRRVSQLWIAFRRNHRAAAAIPAI